MTSSGDSHQRFRDLIVRFHTRWDATIPADARAEESPPDAIGVEVRNRNCGDMVRLSIRRAEGDAGARPFAHVSAESRGCSICTGTTAFGLSLLAERTLPDAIALSAAFRAVVDGGTGGVIEEISGAIAAAERLPVWLLPAQKEDLLSFSVLAAQPARRQCALLFWDAIDELSGRLSESVPSH